MLNFILQLDFLEGQGARGDLRMQEGNQVREKNNFGKI
jgi:hypothetical protein